MTTPSPPAAAAATDAGRAPPPLWLRALGVLGVGLLGAGMLYAVAIGLANFTRIGV